MSNRTARRAQTQSTIRDNRIYEARTLDANGNYVGRVSLYYRRHMHDGTVYTGTYAGA